MFLNELEYKLHGDGEYILTKPLFYLSPKYGKFMVPEGFITDLASVPRLPVVYWLFGGKSQRSAVLHDYLYQTGLVGRKIADEIFLEAMKSRGVSAWTRYGMYWGVRLFGWACYEGAS